MTDTHVEGADASTIAEGVDTPPVETTNEGETQQQKSPEWVPPTREEYEKLQRKAEKRERIIGKTQAQLRAERQSAQKQYQELISRLEKIEGAGKDAKPDANDPKFKSYDEYLDAREEYLKNQVMKGQKDAPRQDSQEPSEAERQWFEERSNRAYEASAKLAKEIPDFQEVFSENEDLFDEMPEHLAKAFLAVENGGLAAYTLLKEGKLESLFTLPEQFAAMEIYQAQARGAALAQKIKKPTNAPPPMSAPNKGTSPGQKMPSDMNHEELMAWAAKR